MGACKWTYGKNGRTERGGGGAGGGNASKELMKKIEEVGKQMERYETLFYNYAFISTSQIFDRTTGEVVTYEQYKTTQRKAKSAREKWQKLVDQASLPG